jgi:flagellar export protein FliJ
MWRMHMRKAKTISKILKLKENKKQEIEMEVIKAIEKVDEEKSKLISLEKDYQEKLTYFNEKNEEGSLTVNNIASYYDFFARITDRIKEQRAMHVQRKSELDSLKNTLVHAHKDKKVFEILKEKTMKQHQKEQALSEQKEADYFVMARKLR